MADPKTAPPVLPTHLEETIQSIDRLHAEHRQDATSLQRAVDSMTTLISRPGFIGVVTVLVAGWAGFNLLAGALGYRASTPRRFRGWRSRSRWPRSTWSS